jgi:raffinose/stachyose/melibiose transport system substrate-binding protein
MTWERRFNLLAVVLVAGCFVLALTGVLRRQREAAEPGRVVLRLAHWQLEAGVKEAFDQIARDYEALHPNVRIVQMRIPQRVFPQWALTQLVGGTAPDLIEIGYNLESLQLARYLTPITEHVGQPNPYNAGTPLEGMPWRSTFVDGLAVGYNDKLGDYYGVPTFFATVRVFYNRNLMRQITGRDVPPATFDEFIRLCEQARDHAATSGAAFVPISGSRDNAPFMLDELFEGMSQKLVQEFSRGQGLYASQDSFFLALLADEWSVRSPAVRAGLEVMREVGRFMQPGFLQLRREDALFAFTQGNALMLAAGSWETSGLVAQSQFPIGVFRMPLPGPDHPRYGRFTWGRPAEASGRAVTGPFGLTRGSRYPAEALDFLRYLTSQRAHQKFVEQSRWLPVVVGVKVPASMQGFEPDLNGSLPGLNLRWGTEIRRVTENNWHLLFSETGGVEAFSEAVAPELPAAAVGDLRRRDRRSAQQIMLADPGLESMRQLLRHAPDEAALAFKFQTLLQGQNDREAYYYQIHYRLAEAEARAAAKGGDKP